MKTPIESEIMKRIGLLIRERRKKMGWTQTDLANQLFVSYQQIYKYEAGKDLPSIFMLVRMCAIFDMRLHTFIMKAGIK